MKQVIDNDECIAVLTEALNVYDKKRLTARDAIDEAADTLKKRHLLPELNERFKKASLMPRFGRGENFHRAVIETMIGTLSASALINVKVAKNKREIKISLNNIPLIEKPKPNQNIQAAMPQQTIKSVKPIVGASYKLVAEMGLKEINSAGNCQYQLSRKRFKLTLPKATEVIFTGTSVVGDSTAKKLIFLVKAGSPAIINDKNDVLSHDVVCSGVLNHIDPNDSYNLALDKTRQKRLAKAELKKRLIK